MKAFSSWLAVMLLAGAGCDLTREIGWNFPPALDRALPAADPAAATAALDLEPGLSFTVRPSSFGIGGTIDDALGLDARAMRVSVDSDEPESSLRLSWATAAATGTLALHARGSAGGMLLPGFWPVGDAKAEGNGGLWLSSSAYDALMQGKKVEWRLGLGGHALAALEAAFQAFRGFASQMTSAGGMSDVSPSSIEKTALIEAYPLAVDGRITLVRAVKASGWFADLVVLADRDNPLVLAVTVRPAAAPALQALEPAGIRWQELGYEITSISRP